MKFGYYCGLSARNKDSTVIFQRLEDHGCEEIFFSEIYREQINGRQFRLMMSKINEGDVVFIENLASFGHRPSSFLYKFEAIRARKAHIVSLDHKINTLIEDVPVFRAGIIFMEMKTGKKPVIE